MKIPLLACLAAFCAALGTALPAYSATFTMDQGADVVAPSSRGNANTTFFGWEAFDDPGAGNPINDTTPDLGTTSVGAAFATTNGEAHRLGSNIYILTAGHTLYEQVTVPTSGTVGTSGTTTIIAQFVTASGNFPNAPITLSSINGVLPVVVRGVNSAGEGQVWAKWQIPGNAASYNFTITGAPLQQHFSIDRVVVDTHWSSTTPQPDEMIAASPPTFKMDQLTTVVAPTTRGGANTTWLGWDTFCDIGGDTVPINDTTPDLGTTTNGVRFVTTNGEDHISSSRNLYVGFGTLAEEVTIVTDGTVDTGFTTIIAQAVTAFGGFPSSAITFGSIGGVAPEVVVTTNIAGKGQVWAKWKVPGNKASYTFTVSGPAGVSGWSFDQFVVDTYWNAANYQTDSMTAGNPAQTFTMEQVQDVLTPSSRGNANTTHFGWEVFTNPAGNATDPINDTTPDIGNTATAGVSIVTQNGEDHLTSTNNMYVGGSGRSFNELVTVVTNAPPGTPASGNGSGTTTIIAQAVSQAGAIRTPYVFGPINGIEPTIVTATNAAGKGQLWAKWIIPGNPASSYSFTITSPPVTDPNLSISIDRLVVDTIWRGFGSQPDVVRASTPAVAHVMSTTAGLVTPSTRGNVKTTSFGWETLNNSNNRTAPVVIDDSTPDLGYTTLSGARFRTTNGETHVLGSGNIYFFAGTLAEEITVPTNGVVGSGFTTVILQIASAPGFGAFADDITLGAIEGVQPQIVQELNSTGTGQLWAKWQIPGNAATYTIPVSGPANQAHFSFDKVQVDTFWSPTSYQGDSMAELPPSISTPSPLLVAGVNGFYANSLTASGGHAPYTFTISAGSLPAGLTLSALGAIDGTPTATGTSNFTVLVTDANGLTASKAFTLTVTTTPNITTAATLPTGLTGAAYTQTLAAADGTTPYTWSIASGSSLPAGLSLNTSTGELSGMPTAAGLLNFDLTVTDANGFHDTQTFNLSLINLTINTATALPNAVKNVAYSTTLNATGGLGTHTWSFASGSTKPAGLDISPAGVLSGTPTGAGAFNFSLEVSDGSFTVSKAFTLSISEKFIAPVVVAPNFPVGLIGVNYSHPLAATNYPKVFSVVGLPKGLKLAANGIVSGRPEVVGVFNVQIQASNTGGKSLFLTAPLTIKALDKDLVGTFAGWSTRDQTANGRLGSKMDLTTTSKGSYSLKVLVGAKATTFTGFLAATAPHITVTLNSTPLTLSINDTTGALTGGHGSATITGWRSTWNVASNPADTRDGYYSFALDLADQGDDGVVTIPQGSGFATFTLSNAGLVTLAGKSGDGESITSSSILGPDGQLLVHGSQYKNLGSILGGLSLSEDPQGEFWQNTISGNLTWFKPATPATRAYPNTFGPLNIAASGKYLAATNKEIVLGLPDIGNSVINFADGGLALAQQDPNMTFGYTDDNKVSVPTAVLLNPTKLALAINKNTGAVSGNFTLVETTPSLTRAKVPFAGQIVRKGDGSVRAIGHFLLPQIPVGAEKATVTPILSGGLTITPQQPE